MRIWLWIDTSSADSGSSATISAGAGRQRAGDGDALALAAGELVRVAVQRVARQPDLLDQFAGPRPPLGAAADALDAQRLGDDVGDRHARVERAERVLEHDLDRAPRFLPRRGGPCGWPRKRSVPAVGSCSPATTLPSVVLPLPLSPTSAERLALGDGEADIRAALSMRRLPPNRPPPPRSNCTLMPVERDRSDGSLIARP